MKRRVVSLVIAMALCLNLCPVWALAADTGADSGLCAHHPAHTDTCGYALPSSGRACTHTHDDGCYTAETNCVHEHTAECCQNSDGDSPSDEPVSCAHVCTEESGCITRTLSCPHVHDDECGYVPEDPGAPCGFVCRICPLEELIGGLPDSLTEVNSEQVYVRIGEIYDLYEELTAEEQQQVDLSPCEALLGQMDGLTAAVQSEDSASDQTLRLSADVTYDYPYEVSKLFMIDTNGHTFTGTAPSTIRVTASGNLDLRGTVVSNGVNSIGVEVQTGGSLRITEAGTKIDSQGYAISIASGATVQLSTGTYIGNLAAIQTADGNYADLLASGCAYFDENGNPILPADVATERPRTLIVKKCTNHVKTYAHKGALTHTWTCKYCGTTETEKCTFSTYDQDGKSICDFRNNCDNEITVKVERDSLKVLAYDDTVKPANGTVTVTPKGAAELVADRDYTVSYKTRADVGSTDITVTVTVDGVAYNGTFERDYTFTKAELTRPVLEWSSTNAVSVLYTGSEVTKDELPAITINITTDSGVNLYNQLQYSYRIQGSDSAYTEGLPTNTGIYDVVVTLPEGTDYQAASSEPITLTINPIAPVDTAPAAATPTYNRTAQELVTAGVLCDAAVADGLEIEFATSQTGPWSTDIPTGTNAGTYTVWYQVAGLTDNYIAPDPNPAEITGVEILRKPITPVVELSQYKYLYDGGFKEPAVTVKDVDHVTVLLNTEYQVAYQDNRNVGTAKVVVTDKPGGNYAITQAEATFEITSKTQDTLSITNKPSTFTYGDRFTLGTSGGSGNGDVTWEIVPVAPDVNVATVDRSSGQVTITGHGSVTVKATKSGKDPDTNVVNYEDATATWSFTAVQKPVTATVTAEDKDYDGDDEAIVHAVVEEGVLPGDEVTITGLTGTFDGANAGVDKTVTVVTTGATISGKNSGHYAVSYSAATVKATICKAVAKITTAPVPATLIYDGTAHTLIQTGAVIDATTVVSGDTVEVEYALSEDGPYSTDSPKETNAGTYTVWYRVKETDNYIGLAPASVDVTIDKKPVSPTITLDQVTFVYDGSPKEPVVTLYEADGTTLIPAGEYTVEYSNNINVNTVDTPATLTVTAKADGNYTFENAPVTATFTITEKQAEVLTAPEAAGLPLTFNTFAQRLVTAGVASGGTMVYSVNDENGTYSKDIPTATDAGTYKVYYKVQGDGNHSDSDVGSVEVTIAPKRVDNPTIELFDGTNPLVNYTYDGNAKTPNAVVKDGSTVIGANEYEIRYDNNIDAGNTATVNIIGKSGGNYDVTGSKTFVIQKANIVFHPAPSAANITYDGKPHELLVPGTTSGGTVQYALGSATSAYSDAIPTGTDAGMYTVYYKVVGDKNHNDLNDLANQKVEVTIQRRPLTAPTIELIPDSFEYDGNVKLPTVTVKDGKTVLPEEEYTWTCDVASPTNQGTYTITVTDAAGGNYDLSGVTANTATFTIGQTAQLPLVIEDKPDATIYGDTFTLTTSGGSGTGAVTWSVTGPATVGPATGEVKITDVGAVTITATNPGDQNYLQASAQWTFTAEPKPVTASIVVNGKPYDGNTTAAVASASITTINSDTVTITPASITAAFDDPHAGTGKTVTLDTSKVQVTGDDAAKYAIRYPDTVTADITQATTTITTAPKEIAPLTYNRQPQALVTAGQTNVGFLVYSLNGTDFSPEIPTGTNAGTYTVYYRVDETSDYTGVAANTIPISVTIGPKNISTTVKVELSESSFLYDGTKKNPIITVKDDKTLIDTDQYSVTWANDDTSVTDGLLTAAGKYTATITNVTNGNYSFNTTAKVEIKAATQAALDITGTPDHVYYGGTVTTLKAAGGSSNGTVKWSITAGKDSADIDLDTGVLTVKGTGSVTVTAERTVPNYALATGTWTFTVEPKPVVAEVTVTPKTYDGTTDIADTAITAKVKAGDIVNGDTVTLSGLTGVYDDANAGTGKTVTLNSTGATATGTDAAKYAVSYPATAKGDINPKNVTVTVKLSGNDLKTDTSVTPNVYYYEYDGTAKTPAVTVTGADGAYSATLADSDYSVSIIDNKNVGDATVTVTAKAGGNYTFTAETVNFEIRSAAAVLTTTPQAKNLTYEKGTEQELVTVGTADGGTVVYALKAGDAEPADDSYSEGIPKGENAGTYTVYYKVKGDDNHISTEPSQVSVTIKAKEITPAITLSDTTYTYDGTAKTPTVTVMDGTETIGAGEYSVSYRDNVNAGTATVTVSDANGGNYIVNGSITFEITKAAPTVTNPTAKTDLYYTGETQELVNAGVSGDGTVVYSVNGGNDSAAVPTASAVGTYTVSWKVIGDANHSDTASATLTVKIEKNTVTKPAISLSSDQFKYNGSQQKPTITVYDDHSCLIPEHEYTVEIKGTNGNVGMVDVDTYTVTITTPATSNYVIADDGTVNNTRTFEIVAADQEAISITGTKAQVRYGDTIQLGTSGGSGDGTITWTVTGGNTISATGLLTVKDVGGPYTVTVKRSRGGNYTDVSATWEFTAAKKPVTAEVTVADRNYAAGDKTAVVTASVPNSVLVTGDSITITGLSGMFDTDNVGTGKTVTVNSSNPTVTGTNSEKYDITYPATTTASILAVAATVDTPPEAAASLIYDASQSQALVTAGSATGGTMVYSLDGKEFTPNIPKGKDAGTYTVYYKAQGDGNHTDSAVGTVDVTIDKQSVTPQIELTPPSAQYDGQVKRPEVTVRDTANNVIPTSEYTVIYDFTTNWKDVGKHKVKVQNITGGNYIITNGAEAEFEISTTAQNPLEITNRPGLVYYGDTFTLSAIGGSGSEKVTWSSNDENIAHIDANGFVTIKGVGSATITATKEGGGNYETATATYPLNALKKPITATVTAEDRVYVSGDVSATIHVTWEQGALVGTDNIDTTPLSGTFADDQVGAGKTVTITGTPASDATSQKYDITIPANTTASITKATATAPAVTGNTLTYTGIAQALVTGGNTGTTLYSASKDGIYSAAVPTGTNAGMYTVWYKEKGDANHNESAPQAIQVTISPKALTVDAANVELSGSDLQTDTSATPNVYYYQYDGTDKTPTVTIKDGAAVVPASEYTVSYSNNKNVSTADKKATVTITDNEGGNYIVSVSGTVGFEIRAGGAQLTGSPQAKNLTYTGQPQELVTVGTATGGHIEYRLMSVPTGEPTPNSEFSTSIPTGTNAGTYTVEYKVVGDDNHEDDATVGSVTVTIQPKTVISPQITVTGTYTYDGTEQKPTGTAVTVEDGGTTIPDTEYTLSYQNNTNAGTATVIVTDNNGGNYTVSGTAAFEIGKAAAAVGTAPTGKTGLHYNGTAQELLDTKGMATGGTLVYSLSQTGEYSAAIPTGKAVGEYEIWYKVLGDANHSDSMAAALSPKVEIAKNTVTNPTIQVTPASVKYTGEKQTPTVTVKDDAGLLIDGSEYEVTYADTANGNNSDLIQVGTYTVTVTGEADGNYTFDATDGKNTATFTILPADQTPLAITGTREKVCYGDTIPLGTTGGIDGGTVTWAVSDGNIADITNGLLTIKGVGSVTVTATSTKTGYANQTATWNLYAEKKSVTALVTAASKTYDGNATATVTATLQGSDFVGTDSFTITLTGCTFEDPNAGTDKKVNVVGTTPTFTVNAGGTNCYENYAINYPATATASIFKANIDTTKVTAPTPATGLEYTGRPLTLVTAGTVTEGGTMEYSTDGINYSASLPTGTDAGSYDVWYRVKGDGNHNDTAGAKLDTQVTIGPQTVDADKLKIEFSPSGASYDGQEHKPTVKLLDAHGRVIPDSEYTVDYGSTNWKDEGNHTVTVTGKTDGNYSITGTPTKTFTILPAGQSPLSIVGQPGEVRYGDAFTLSTNGGSGTGAVTWESSDSTVAFVNSATGRVEIKKAGGPVTITARKAAGGGYGETTATWTFSAEKRPATAIVTARNKPYDGGTTATLDITWKDGDLLNGDTIPLNLTGAFDDANVGTDKIVRISGTVPVSDKYAVTYNTTTMASITATAATVSGVQAGPWTYSGSEQPLLSGGAATNGTIVYSLNGTDFMDNVPTETNAGRYTVWYKARGYTNYADSEVHMVYVTIQPKTVTSPAIELSTESFPYDGTEKKPDVIRVLDGSNVIPASEYTVSYSNNVNVGTTAKVTITDVAGGNYTVNGSKTFTITAGEAVLKEAPKANNLTYNGFEQELVTEGTAVNGQVVYAESKTGSYSTSIPMKADAGTYQVWYKVQGSNGAADTTPKQLIVTIRQKEVTPVIRIGGRSSYSVAYNGSAQEPDVTVYVESKEYSDLYYTVEYDGNDGVGTAEVTVTSTGGNYQFLAFKTFTITKGKAAFMSRGEPVAKTNLVYTGEPQDLVEEGIAEDINSIVVYSLDRTNYSPLIPTGTNRGSYTVYAKVQGNEFYEDSAVVVCRVTIDVNALTADQLTVSLSANSFPHTGSEQKPTVTVTDKISGNVISADEYTVTYSDNVAVGTAKVSIKSKTNGNYSFTAEKTFTILAAGQTPLTITGKPDTVCYGDVLRLGTTGGSGDGAVTWSASGPVDRLADGQYKITSSGGVTITATKAASGSYGASSDTWTFYAQPKPVTAVVTAASRPYNGDTTVTLTVTISGLVSGDTVDTVTAQGHFADANVGENKPVVITGLTIPDAVSKMYDIGYNSTTTASITPKAAAVTAAPTLATGPLTYNGGAQALLASGGAADGGNLMYSLDGKDYSYTIPTGTDAKTYTVWYKVEASDENHKDSSPVKLGDVTISADTDTPSVLCTPSTVQYDGTEKTPAVVVRDSAQRIIPESEYTVAFDPGTRIAVGKYKVTVIDKPGGNYEFTSPVTVADAFEIVSASQNPLSIITSIPNDVSYGDTFRLSAQGGSGSGAIQWSIAESSVATIDSSGNVKVTGIGGFTVKAFRKGADGYSDSNTDSVPFVANPKPVTPVVTASDKSYDGKIAADLTATWKSGDLVNGDTIALTVSGVFDTADAGNNKRVSVIGNATGTDTTLAKYAITWPDRTTASIYKVDAKLKTAPAGADLTYNKSAQNLVTAGSTVDNIGTVVYSTSQNGAYSETIPTGTDAGKYTVWYKVADSVNYTGIAPAAIEVEIKKATPAINTAPTASGTAGQKLSEIRLEGGATNTSGGKFAWENPETVAENGKSYNAVFTPDDTTNYNTVTIQVVAASSTPSGDSGTSSSNSANSSGGTSNTYSAPVRTTVSNGTANTTVSAAAGSDLVRKAAAERSDSIVIKPEVTGSVTKSQVSLPASTVEQIQSETSAALTVSAPIADVTIPNGALNTLSTAGGTVNIATEQVGDAVALTLTAGGEKVESVPGGVTLSVPAEDAGPGTVAVLVREDGTREVIQKSVAKDGSVSVPLEGSATVEIVDNSKTFDDVPSESWAADAVAFASAHELFSGTSETTFSPDESMSRGMLTTVLYNLENRPDQDLTMEDLTDGYSDVSGDAWYAEGVAWAVENGIAAGYGNGQFGPNDSVTREQLAVMLWKYAGSPEADSQTLGFTDADQASGYAEEALRWAAEKGVLNGYNGELNPKGTATRAQAAQMLKNFMENT